MQTSPAIFALNSGVVSDLALARVDLAKMKLAASVQENLLPTVLGPAVFRPGMGFLDQTLDDEEPVFIPFVYAVSTTAMIVATTGGIQFLVDGVFLTRPSVSATITNGTFNTDLTGWTDADEGAALSDWSSGNLRLTGTTSARAIRHQLVTVTEPGVEHALRITVARGPLVLRVGSTAGDDDYIAENMIGTGEHSRAFTPSGNFYVWFASEKNVSRLVDSVTVEAAGRVTLDNPWTGSEASIRYAQSGSVLFCACRGKEQRKIVLGRANLRSWGVELYQTSDGPFRFLNTGPVTITPGSVVGPATHLIASRDIFKSGHVGSIWRLTHSGQTATATLSGEDQFTDSVRVKGVHLPASANTRPFRILITGLTGTGTTVTLQRSFGVEGAWVDVSPAYTTDQDKTFDDGFDNQIVFYRLGIVTGDYSSGTIVATLNYPSSVQLGIVRIVAFDSETEVEAEVIETLGATTATSDWEEGVWSEYRGFPSSVKFHDGRLVWGFNDSIYESVSDAFDSYDDQVEGDSGPVIRSVATGPVEGILWLLSMGRLFAGTASQEVKIQASNFDGPITPTDFTAREVSNRGSANIQAISVDGRGVFVQRNGTRVYLIIYNSDSYDYITTDATRLAREVCEAGVVGMVVQRQPDTRIWFWLDDGTAAVLTYEPSDEVIAWTTVTTTGDIKAVGILPGSGDDEVYFAVERSPTSGAIMCVEKLAQASESVAGIDVAKVMDGHIVYDGVATDTITELDHLEGLSVVAWGDGVPLPGPFTVASGAITLPTAYENVCVGLPYTGKFKTAKLAQGGQTGTAMSKLKRVDHVSLLMADVAWYGVKAGKDFDNLFHLPRTLGNGRALALTESLDTYDYGYEPFNGGWGPDERICFQTSSPYPAIFLGVALTMTTSDPAAYGTRPSSQG